MRSKLQQNLHRYIVDHNPELLLKLQGEYTVSSYIDDKVSQVMVSVEEWIGTGIQMHEVEEMALRSMTTELRPSRFLYLKEVIEEEFPQETQDFTEAGVLTYELVNLIEHCQETLDQFSFSEANRDDRKLRYAVIADIAAYLN